MELYRFTTQLHTLFALGNLWMQSKLIMA